MSASRVEYHEGAAADVRMPSLGMKNENLKLPWTSSRNSIAPQRQSEKRQNVWPFGSNHIRRFLLWRFPFTIIYSHKEDVVTIWPSLMEAVVPNIGRSGCDV